MTRATVKWIKVALIGVCALSLAGAARADILKLKNGEMFRGKIVVQNEREVQLEVAPGAVQTFPRSQIESIEAERTPAPAPAPTATSKEEAPSEPAKDFKDLREQVSAIEADLKKLQEEFDKLRKGTEEIAARTQQMAEPRGDKPGQPPSDLKLVNMRWSRAGDTIKIEGAITNKGGSPGRWSRVTALVKDIQGNVLARGDTRPVAQTGGTVKDGVADRCRSSTSERLGRGAHLSALAD
jgi:hypothetical protein